MLLNGSNACEALVANPAAGSVLRGFGGNDILYSSDLGESFTGGTADRQVFSAASESPPSPSSPVSWAMATPIS